MARRESCRPNASNLAMGVVFRNQQTLLPVEHSPWAPVGRSRGIRLRIQQIECVRGERWQSWCPSNWCAKKFAPVAEAPNRLAKARFVPVKLTPLSVAPNKSVRRISTGGPSPDDKSAICPSPSPNATLVNVPPTKLNAPQLPTSAQPGQTSLATLPKRPKRTAPEKSPPR